MGDSVLLLEDEPELADPLIFALERDGYVVTWVRQGAEAMDRFRETPLPDLFIADRGLPDMDGLDVIRQVRADGYDGAIIVLSARATEVDLVQGLDIGADDYLTKPFGFAELSARIRATLRRSTEAAGSVAVVPGRVVIDEPAHRVSCDGADVDLSQKEFAVLARLAASENTVVRREELMAEVWGENWYGSPKTLDVTIGRLRQKLGEAGVRDQIVAIRGVGFRFERGRLAD